MKDSQHHDSGANLIHYDEFNEIEDVNEEGDALAKAKILEEHLKAREAMRNENQDVDLEGIESFISMITDEEKEVINNARIESEEQEQHIDQEEELDQRNLGLKSKIRRELDRLAAEKRRLKEEKEMQAQRQKQTQEQSKEQQKQSKEQQKQSKEQQQKQSKEQQQKQSKESSKQQQQQQRQAKEQARRQNKARQKVQNKLKYSRLQQQQQASRLQAQQVTRIQAQKATQTNALVQRMANLRNQMSQSLNAARARSAEVAQKMQSTLQANVVGQRSQQAKANQHQVQQQVPQTQQQQVQQKAQQTQPQAQQTQPQAQQIQQFKNIQQPAAGQELNRSNLNSIQTEIKSVNGVQSYKATKMNDPLGKAACTCGICAACLGIQSERKMDALDRNEVLKLKVSQDPMNQAINRTYKATKMNDPLGKAACTCGVCASCLGVANQQKMNKSVDMSSVMNMKAANTNKLPSLKPEQVSLTNAFESKQRSVA